MDLTPINSTTKKVRAKSTTAAPKEKKDKVAATKAVRARKKAVSVPESMPASGMAVSSEQLTAMIATAAYYIAAARNFAPGNEMEDWLEAERQVLNSL